MNDHTVKIYTIYATKVFEHFIDICYIFGENQGTQKNES